ncbi:hypothetical protein R6Q57_013093 [Mikania cordata]
MYSGFDQEQQTMQSHNNQLWPNHQFQTTGSFYNQPPSQGNMGPAQGNSRNQFQETTANRGLDQTRVTVDETKAPSFTDMGHGQGKSYNYQHTGISRGLVGGGSIVTGTGGGPLSVGDMVKGRVSETIDRVGSYPEERAPSHSDMGQRGRSDTGSSPGVVFDGLDPQELVGISLVGKNFRKFYPNAFFKEEDDEN